MQYLMKTAAFAVVWMAAASALADTESIKNVPELDGGYALLALGLVAAVVAFVKERRRS